MSRTQGYSDDYFGRPWLLSLWLSQWWQLKREVNQTVQTKNKDREKENYLLKRAKKKVTKLDRRVLKGNGLKREWQAAVVRMIWEMGNVVYGCYSRIIGSIMVFLALHGWLSLDSSASHKRSWRLVFHKAFCFVCLKISPMLQFVFLANPVGVGFFVPKKRLCANTKILHQITRYNTL